MHKRVHVHVVASTTKDSHMQSKTLIAYLSVAVGRSLQDTVTYQDTSVRSRLEMLC